MEKRKIQIGRILWVIERDDDLRGIIAYLGENMGFQVVEFSGISDAWRALSLPGERQVLPPRLVIIDTDSSAASVKRWVEEVQVRFPGTSVVGISQRKSNLKGGKNQVEGVPVYQKPDRLGEVLEIMKLVAELSSNRRSGKN